MMIVATPSHLDELQAVLRDSTYIGVDTEFHAERSYIPTLYLVQIRAGDRTWIVDPLQDDHLDHLRDAMLSVEWVVHGGSQDLRILHDRFGAVPDRVWDTQIAAGLVSSLHFPAGFDRLVATFLEVDLAKTATLSDWSQRPLSEEQLRYASEDVIHLLPLWETLEERVRACGRTDWLVAACDEARTQAIEPNLDELWRHFPGIAKLAPNNAAILQELVRWRELQARSRGCPPRSIAGRGTLMAIARQAPTTLRPLQQNRRMPRGLIKRHGDELLDFVRRGLERPAFGCPRHVRRDTQAAIARDVLFAGARVICSEQQLGRRLMVPDLLLDRFLVDPHFEPGWRHTFFEMLQAILDGDRILTFQDGRPTLR